MNHTTVDSSFIKSVSYDDAHKVLHVEMKNGRRYRAHDVEPEDHAAFAEAKSVGGHFNSLKAKYEFVHQK